MTQAKRKLKKVNYKTRVTGNQSKIIAINSTIPVTHTVKTGDDTTTSPTTGAEKIDTTISVTGKNSILGDWDATITMSFEQFTIFLIVAAITISKY